MGGALGVPDGAELVRGERHQVHRDEILREGDGEGLRSHLQLHGTAQPAEQMT